jgi:hypothetical protein
LINNSGKVFVVVEKGNYAKRRIMSGEVDVKI